MYCIVFEKIDRKCSANPQYFFFLIEKQCPVLRTEGHQFIQDNRDKLEVPGKCYNPLQRRIMCKIITKHVTYCRWFLDIVV